MTETHSPKSIISSLERPITIVGMMGSGKSTLGAALASTLGWPFFDSDKVIEAETGKTIPQIFETEGDAAFRQRERDTLTKLFTEHPRAIIATGGGSITIPETADMIFAQSLSLWVYAPVDILVSRTSRQSNRPLLKTGDPKEILTNLLEKREDIYRRADVHVETAEIPVAEVVERAMRQISEYLLNQKS